MLCGAVTVSAPSATEAAAAGGEPPVRVEVLAEPHAVTGSDGNHHLVYELMLTNTTDKTTYYVTEVTALDGGTKQPVALLGAVQLLVEPPPAPRRNILHPGELGFLFVHVAVAAQAPLPSGLRHEVIIIPTSINAPLTIAGGETTVVQAPPVVLGPPLRGSRYIAGDGCCDAPRHVQAVMPGRQGGWWNAQRFAIDWEQLDEQNRLWVAQPGREQAPRVEDYVVYGKDLLAVADGTVVGLAEKVLPDQPPGRMPSNLPREEADGNHVILDLGNGVYVLYAHLKPNSVAVTLNQRVSKGQVIGKVGNSGNTSAPHLHLQAMDRPSSLDANGLPYVFERFRIVGFDPLGSDDFQAAEDEGRPATIAEVSPPSEHARQLPLNVVVVDWMN
jgi:hypothetical protein